MPHKGQMQEGVVVLPMMTRRTLAMALMLFLAGCSGSADSDDADQPPAPGDDAFKGLVATDTTGVIRGIVVDQTIRPLGGALVETTVPEKGKVSATSLEDGSFGFDKLPEGTYFLRVT